MFSNPCFTWASKVGALTRRSGKQRMLGFSGRRQPGCCLRAPGPCVAVMNYLARPVHDALRPFINAASCETRAAEQKFQAGASSRSIPISFISWKKEPSIMGLRQDVQEPGHEVRAMLHAHACTRADQHGRKTQQEVIGVVHKTKKQLLKILSPCAS
jgi:hypothetical protein